jgi:hypothetical protein
VRVAPDGALLVNERITFDFSGPFSGAYRDIPLRSGETIDHVGVGEGGRPYRPGGDTELGSVDKPGTYGVERRRDRVRVVSGTIARRTSDGRSRSGTGSAGSRSPTTTSSTSTSRSGAASGRSGSGT